MMELVTSSNKEEDRDRDDAAAAAAVSFDFVRFTLSDIHGVSRSKVIPRIHVNDALNNGIGICAGKLNT